MKKVLIWDDDEDILEIIQNALTYAGFEVKGITETSDIFSTIRSNRPDLLLIDYLLSGINGGDICNQIKANTKTSDLPVILISAYPMGAQLLGHYQCDDFIAKPFDLDDLVLRVKKLTQITVGKNQKIE